MLTEMSAGGLKCRLELTELLLQREGMFDIKQYVRVFMRNVMAEVPNTVQDFRITLPHGAVKLTKGWHVNEDDCNRMAAQWLSWIQEDLK